MAFDSPDYFNRYSLREAHEGTRRVIFEDDFESTKLKWSIAGTVVRQFDYAHTGEAAAQLNVGAVAGNIASMSVKIGLPSTNVLLIDLMFSLAGEQYLTIYADYHYAGTRYRPAVRYDDNANKWQYYSSAGAWVDVPNGAQVLWTDAGFWHHLKMVVDYSLVRYRYLVSDRIVFDLSSYAINSAGGALSEIIDFAILTENIGGGAGKVMYIDSVTLAEG